jgi:predicted hydrocarbon binding protein
VKGIIFNLLEQVVTDELGEETWERVLDEAGVDGAYTAVGTYEHEELHNLARTAARLTGKTDDEIVRWFGERAVPLLIERYPQLFEAHSSTISLLLQLNDVIHPEVPGAYAPEFDVDWIDEQSLALGYESYRDLCLFAEGLVQGTAAHFGESVTIEQTSCTRRGGERCVLVCRFS